MGSRGLQEGFKSVCVCALRTCSDSKSSRRCLAVPSAVTAAESRERSDAASARRREGVPTPDPGSPPEGVWKRGSTGRCAGEGAAGGAAAADEAFGIGEPWVDAEPAEPRVGSPPARTPASPAAHLYPTRTPLR